MVYVVVDTDGVSGDHASLASALSTLLNTGSIRIYDGAQTVNDVAYTKDAAQLANKAELDALAKEFVALNVQAVAAKDWLDANVTEF